MTTRHYRWIKGFALAALVPLFAACSSEEDSLVQGGGAQPVQIDITRATTDGNDWTWQEGDQIGLSITDYGATTATSYTLTCGANGSWSSDPSPIIVTLPATAEAWWPKSASASEFSFTHDNNSGQIQPPGVPMPSPIVGTVDQSTTDKLIQNDWMTSGSSTIGSNRSLSLTLQHRLCKVSVTITSDEEVKEVRFFSCLPNAPQGVTAVSFDRVFITPYQSNTTYTAIVSAREYNNLVGNLPFMRIKVGDSNSEKWVYIPNNIGDNGRLEAGNAYTFNLTVRNSDATTRSAGISDYELELVEVRDMNEE